MAADDINDIYFAREPVEARAVRTLAERATVPREAERALALMGVAAQLGQPADHAGADIALHRALVAAVGSQRLQRMHETVMGESELCIVQVRDHEGLDLTALTAAHAAILDAIRAGDPDAAERALHNDLNGCRETLLSDVARREAALSAS
jgi:DNA-binding GntR family transcriptional regulator